MDKYEYAVFLSLANFSPVAELHLAHIINLQKISNKSSILGIICDGKFGGCSINPTGLPATCYFCRLRATRICNISGIKYIYLSEFKPKDITYTPNSLFLGAMSSVASHTRAESISDLSCIWKFILKRLHIASIKTYKSIKEIIRIYDIKELYIFNGRYSCGKAAKEAARNSGIDFSVYDVRQQYRPYINKNIDLHNAHEAIKRANLLFYKNPEQSTKVAIKYFNDRRNQKSTFETSYTDKQQLGFYGKLNKSKQLIVIYTSSDDEYRFLGNDWGISQRKVLQSKEIFKLITNLPSEDFEIVIRIHPNQIGVRTSSLQSIRSLPKRDNVTVHDPDSVIDSYALLDKADAVITFASSISLEASYWKKLLIQIGPSPYSPLNIGYNFNSAIDCIDFLKANNRKLNKIKILDSKNAIIFANYLMSYFDPLDGFERVDGIYKVHSITLPVSRLSRILSIPEKLIIYITKRPNVFSKHFIRKILITIEDIIQGTFRDII
ncbi:MULTISPECIES: hypothetical protein [unclassified Prochlorococcus]|uniref:hypothetical protein n=1 Tax=unclassified Prochlorococcus TaxID=2627481 RepID=UPI0005337872|nr:MULTISPECIES: hypothetical protein [unclassified Prochlorococcus]KGG16320.1 hypothetical protein EV07_1489 [Prochlorococcus sp. MIT 0603]KGG17946.1 hypothetical protein EV06_0069 [Prochlorococcus sp. MIT 0602]